MPTVRGRFGASVHLRRTLTEPCGRSQGAWSSAVHLHSAMLAILGQRVVCHAPSRLSGCLFIYGAPSLHHTDALRVPGHLQCTLRAPCGRSWGARSSTVRPPDAIRVLSRHQVICSAPSGRHAGALGASNHRSPTIRFSPLATGLQLSGILPWHPFCRPFAAHRYRQLYL